MILDAWEREHDPLTVEELRRAEAELGLVVGGTLRVNALVLPARSSPASAASAR